MEGGLCLTAIQIRGNQRPRSYFPKFRLTTLQTEIASLAHQKYSTVVCVGGDGTSNEIVNGLLQASREGETISISVVPLGTGDDFAMTIPPETPLGGNPFSWQDAVRKIKRGDTKLLDVGRIQIEPAELKKGRRPHYFANSMNIGFGAQGVHNAARTPKIFKSLTAYFVTALWTLLNYSRLPMRILLDNQPPI
ncbi:MAG: diacylglycerol kinase family protein [Anaerolineales bacterium]